jgi:hypothetical protein
MVPADLIESQFDKATNLLKILTRKCNPQIRDEIYSEGYLALTVAANAWEGYCARTEGADPEDLKHFWAYASRRLKGCAMDYFRVIDNLTRAKRVAVKAGDGEQDVAPWKLRFPMLIDTSEHRDTAYNSEAADASLLVSAALDKAIVTIRNLSMAEQCALVFRLSSNYDEWSAAFSSFSLASKDAATLAVRTIRNAVAELVGVEPLPVLPNHQLTYQAAQRIINWKPSEQFLELMGCQPEEFVERFVAELRDDPGVLNEILALARPNRKKEAEEGIDGSSVTFAT